LKGATRHPRRAYNRQSPVTSRLFPADYILPNTIKVFADIFYLVLFLQKEDNYWMKTMGKLNPVKWPSPIISKNISRKQNYLLA
jgi:hypothetical protein